MSIRGADVNGPPEPFDGAADTAWRIHAVLMDWTGKVDAKASFALSLESAALTAFAALSDARGAPFGAGRGAAALLYWAGMGLLGAAIVMAVTVVVPRLDGRRSRTHWHTGFVYFGHLRHWTPDRLTEALCFRDPTPVVSRQLIGMSRVAWRKHRLVQASLVAAVAGAATTSAALIAG